MADPIEIRTNDEAADIVTTNFGSKELRALASNAGVSRERGDTKRATAEKIVAQDPALAARIIENDDEVDMDASAFREERQVDDSPIDISEAIARSRHGRMESKLRSLEQSLMHVPSYEVEIDWEYGGEPDDDPLKASPGYVPGLTSITVKSGQDVSWMLKGRAHILLTPHGRCVLFDVEHGTWEGNYIDRNTENPGRQWRLALSGGIERMYESDD